MAGGKYSIFHKILLGCLLMAAVLVAVNLASSALNSVDRGKMDANRIVSPWDNTAAPPVMGPSVVINKPADVVELKAQPSSKRVASSQRHGRRTPYAVARN